MSDWTYIVIAYLVVWGALAGYALLLARRVSASRAVARALRDATHEHAPAAAGHGGTGEDSAVCDAPPAP